MTLAASTAQNGNTMTTALIGSVALHAAVVVLAVVGLPRLTERQPIAPVVAVDLVSVDQLAEAAAQTEAELAGVPEAPEAELAESPAETAELPPIPEAAPTEPPVADTPPAPTPEPVPEPVPPQAAEAPPPPDTAPPPQVAPEPEAAPAPEAQVAEAQEAEALEAEAQPAEPEPQQSEPTLMSDITPPVPQRRPQIAERPEPEPEPEPEPQEEPQDRLQSVLRNVLQNREEPQPRRTQQAARPGPGNALPSSAVVNQLGQIIQSKMAYCWRIDPGARNADELFVVMDIELTREGFVLGEPRFDDPGRINSDRFYRAAAENARRAVLDCQPYTELPQSQYDVWKSIRLRFDPRQMLGG